MPSNFLFTEPTPGVTATHHLFKHDDSPANRLLLILPGRGYGYDMPLLYYLRLGGYDLGYDVLSVQYGFQVDVRNTVPGGNLIGEVNAALALVDSSGYDEIVIVGKSMGTPLAVHLSQQINVSKLVLLTPIQDVVSMTGDIPTLAVIGTADNAYDPSHIEADANRENVEWMVLDDLGHSLTKSHDIEASLNVLPEIILRCVGFLG